MQRLDYAKVAPEAIDAMSQLDQYVCKGGLEEKLLELVRLRVSHLNGCAYCIDRHTKEARAGGEAEHRLYTLNVWREMPYYSPRERAALGWAEAVTQLGAGKVPDEVFAEGRAQFSDKELVDLTLAVVAINGWNRMAITFGRVAGSYRPTIKAEDDVEEASMESFPASDPPGYLPQHM